MEWSEQEILVDKVLERLRDQGLVVGTTSRYGREVVPLFDPTRPPQALIDATARQRDLVALAHATAPAGENRCAAWVELVHARLGYGEVSGHASTLFRDYCHYSDLADLRVGMVVAVPSIPYGSGGSYGHVGLYVGDGDVMDCVAAGVRKVPLLPWLVTYGVMSGPRWGWLGAISLG